MPLTKSIQPISYLKSHASELVDQLAEDGEPLIVTRNGKAKLVVQDIASYERGQETLALLKLVALGRRAIADGQTVSAGIAFKQLRAGRSAAEPIGR